MSGLLDGVLPYIYSRSDALKRQIGGLLSDPMGTLAQTAGGIEDAGRAQQGLLGQAFANPQRPFQVTDQSALMGAVQGAMNGPLGFAPAGITAWHGSPHTFDKFDSSKIGTGEGAQAYGHGLYLAENPDVAKQYADTLTDRAPKSLDGVPADQLSTAQKSALGLLAEAGGNAKAALLKAKTDMARANGAGTDFHVERFNTLRAIAEGQSKAQVGSPGLYKVDLPDSAISKMLDWDKPLGQQAPEVRQALLQTDFYKHAEALSNGPNGQIFTHPDQRTGAEFYRMMSDANPQSADFLRQQGIPGIRYLDGGSRGAGQGSSNFVVFPGEESLLQILERNGVPLGK